MIFGVLVRQWFVLVLVILSNKLVTSESAKDQSERLNAARKFLDYVDKVTPQNCKAGAGEQTFTVQFDTSIWNQYANVAIRCANLISKILAENENIFNSSQVELLFDIVRNNIAGGTIIFGSAIALEPSVVPQYGKLSPYASRQGGVIKAFDLALGYDYLKNDTEWYDVLRNRDWTSVQVETSIANYSNAPNETVIEHVYKEPLLSLGYGHWTDPYFDCDAGDIWMVTYSAPILAYNETEEIAQFKGVATIDIELKEIDINQCDSNSTQSEGQSNAEEGKSVDVFRDTHICTESTTCVAIPGLGFQRGSYKCICKDGYYPKNGRPYINGSEIENAENPADDKFQCNKCKEGCETCVDDTHCLYQYKLAVRITLLVISILMVIGIICSIYVIWMRRTVRIIKAASPIFLYIMGVGAILLCVEAFLEYPTPPSAIICMIKPWPPIIGFFAAYGALLLKTWRISAIIRVQTARKVQLSDKELLKRFIPIIGIPVAYLIAWTIAVPISDRLETKKTTGHPSLKYKTCVQGWWSYGSVIGGILLLVWGAYLCYLIRKAPSHLNESKYITWCIYNSVLLGTFILIIRELVAYSFGPDMIYGMLLLRLQVQVTSMVLLIFAPKFYALYTGVKDGDLKGGGTMNRANPQTVTDNANTINIDVKHRSTQTEVSWTDLTKEVPHSTVPTGERTSFKNNKVHPE